MGFDFGGCFDHCNRCHDHCNRCHDHRNDHKKNNDHNKFNSPICKFLRKFKAGDDVDKLIIGGKPFPVDAFACFDEKTGVATFVKNNGAILVTACDQIDAILINE